MVRVENPKPEEVTQTEMGGEGWDAGSTPRAGVWGGRQRGSGQQGRNCGLKEAVSLLLRDKGPKTISGSRSPWPALRCTGSADLRRAVPTCPCAHAHGPLYRGLT